MSPPPPWSVRAAVAAVAIAAAAVAAGVLAVARARPLAAPALVLGLLLAGLALLAVGLARRVRAAWLWGRYLGFFLGGVLVLGTFLELRHLARAAGGLRALAAARPDLLAQLAIPLAALALPLLVASLALGRASALRWFRLVCPSCGHATTLGTDLRFREARCTECGEVY